MPEIKNSEIPFTSYQSARSSFLPQYNLHISILIFYAANSIKPTLALSTGDAKTKQITHQTKKPGIIS